MSESGGFAATKARQKCGRAHYYPEATDAEWNDWKWQFRHRVTDIEQLMKLIPIPEGERGIRREVLRDFRMGIPPYYLALIDADDPDDPILRQAVPLAEEYAYRDVGDEDPLGEEHYSPVPGITHRYPDRVLMVISNSCAVYCRYCTRKRIMYEDAVPDLEIDRMVDYIARTPAVRDVVISGGDPLTCSTPKLESILAKLRAIRHLEIIRIGTRIPVSLPQRVDAELCEMLQKYHPLWVNVHFNHPRECTPEAARACDLLSRAGIPLNNQAVFLKGVNDSLEVMKGLVHGLMKMRVRPYYVYHCDPVRGSEHMRTTIAKGLEIMEGLRGHTSGLAIPQYVIDAPGGGGKVPINPNYLLEYDQKKQRALLRNYQGRVFEYYEQVPEEELLRRKLVAERLPAPTAGPIVITPSHGSNGDRGGMSGGAKVRTIGNGRATGATAEPESAAVAPGLVVGKSKWAHRGRARRDQT